MPRLPKKALKPTPKTSPGIISRPTGWNRLGYYSLKIKYPTFLPWYKDPDFLKPASDGWNLYIGYDVVET